jgi:hypothetical protein
MDKIKKISITQKDLKGKKTKMKKINVSLPKLTHQTYGLGHEIRITL